jgi:enamine deaminase RidA (YjgF/YER057c/UK114 family)
MQKRFINPADIHKPRGYSHAVAVEGGRTIYISGQVAVDREGNPVGKGDLRAQAEKASENLLAALKAAGASAADIVKMNTYVVGYKPEDYRIIRDVRARMFADVEPPASTLVGVAALAIDGLLIEMEAIAAVE